MRIDETSAENRMHAFLSSAKLNYNLIWTELKPLLDYYVLTDDIVNYCWSKDQQLPSDEGIIPDSSDTCLDDSYVSSPTEVSPQA